MTGLKRFIVILIAFVICGVLQLIVLRDVPVLNAVPNLMLILVMACGFLYGKGTGLFVGTAAGLLMDLLGSGTPGFYTLILALLGYGDGFLSEKMESEMILVLYLLFTANALLFHAYVFVFAFLIGRHFRFLPYVTGAVLPEYLLSLICFLPVYGALIFISKRWDLKVNKGEVKVV